MNVQCRIVIEFEDYGKNYLMKNPSKELRDTEDKMLIGNLLKNVHL
ncbi:MAG: hypothetical protein ABFD82_07925 [Syntrophaceae bacterium]